MCVIFCSQYSYNEEMARSVFFFVAALIVQCKFYSEFINEKERNQSLQSSRIQSSTDNLHELLIIHLFSCVLCSVARPVPFWLFRNCLLIYKNKIFDILYYFRGKTTSYDVFFVISAKIYIFIFFTLEFSHDQLSMRLHTLTPFM